MARAEEVKAKIIMLSNPNNPSSVAYSLEDLEKLAISFKGLLVVDEAYIEFANVESFISRLQHFDNVLVLRTLSKAFGLAGLRVGFAVGSEELIYELDKVIPSFSLSNLTAKWHRCIELYRQGFRNSGSNSEFARRNDFILARVR